MNIILDTHIFLWSLSDPEKINPNKREEIETRANTIYVSSISITEIMIKASLKKLDIRFDPIKMITKSGYEFLDFTTRDAVLLKEIPYHHKDPFDRMLIAQGIANKYCIMTEDAKFRMYACKVM